MTGGAERPGEAGAGFGEDLTARLASLVREVRDWPTPGVSFKDATPLFSDAAAFAACVEAMAGHAGGALGAAGAGGDPVGATFGSTVGATFGATVGASAGVDVVVGIEARGFILAAPVAVRLGAGFVPIRKQGKLAWTTVTADYELEYGSATVEVNSDALTAGDRVLLVDDVLATGGTAEAALGLIRRLGGTVVAASFLIELPALGGRSRLGDVPVHSLLAL